MKYVVFDLEWNQCPNGKEGSIKHLPFEIIEIGAVKLNEKMEFIGEFHGLVKPKAYQRLHYKILEVTHMSMQELKERGRPFPVVMDEFLDWCGQEEYIYCTWGSMDLTELQRNMTYFRIESPFPRPFMYYDVQKLYSLQYGDGHQRLSLDQAVEEQGIRRERPFHRALADAYYTGRILSLLDMRQYGEYMSVDYYRLPKKAREGFLLRFPTYLKYVSGEFDCRETAMKDKAVNDILCPECGRMLHKTIRWFPFGQRFCFALGECPFHGYVRAKIRVRKSENDHTYIVKTMREASREDVEELLEKRAEGRKKHRMMNGTAVDGMGHQNQ